jgi:hypothetical protein
MIIWTLLFIVALLVYLMFFWNPREESAVESRDEQLSNIQVRTSSTSPPGSAGMECPWCGHRFPMTWRRYFLSPLGKHSCPACGKQSRFRRTVGVLLRQSLMVSIGGAPCGLFFCLRFDWDHSWLVGWFLGSLLVGLPLDKFYDGRFRRLEKCEKSD